MAITITGLAPARVLPGARLAVLGRDLPVAVAAASPITMGGLPARMVFASSDRIVVEVPPGLEGGATELAAAWLSGTRPVAMVGRPVASGLHQVDSPVCDVSGRVYVTYSGGRGQQVPVSIFRVRGGDAREPFVSGLTNPTSMTIGPDGRLYVSSRFDGTVYRVSDEGHFEVFASELGVACGLAFDADGTMLVGDRSGTIFRVDGDRTIALATLPASVAAFHLAMGPDRLLYVTAPTLAPRDSLYRISADGRVDVMDASFGRPQGMAFDARGTLHVAEALAGEGGIHRWRDGAPPELVVAGPNIVGLTFAPDHAMMVATGDTLYRFAP